MFKVIRRFVGELTFPKTAIIYWGEPYVPVSSLNPVFFIDQDDLTNQPPKYHYQALKQNWLGIWKPQQRFLITHHPLIGDYDEL